MKKFLSFIFILLSVSVFADEIPIITGYVNDNADMLSPATEQSIGEKLLQLEESDSTQVVVLTISSLDGSYLEEFSIKVAEKNKIGQKGKDNGVILLISKEDRKMRIEVGYGLEGVLTDLVSGRIIDNIIKPNFKAGNFDKGVEEGVDAIISVVKGEYKGGKFPQEKGNAILFNIIFFAIMFFIFFMSGFGPRLFFRGGGGSPFSGGFSGGGFTGMGSSGRGGGFSGGGGSFGGGGASGGW